MTKANRITNFNESDLQKRMITYASDQFRLGRSKEEKSFDMDKNKSEQFIKVNMLQNNFNDAIEQLTYLCM